MVFAVDVHAAATWAVDVPNPYDREADLKGEKAEKVALLKGKKPQPPADSYRSQWGGILVAALVLALVTHTAVHNDVMAAGRDMLARLQGGAVAPPLTPLEEQLMGCRTFKGQEIPTVDTTASLAVLDGYSEQQRRVAEAYTAALAACTDFACVKRANKLPRAPGQFPFPTFFLLGFPKCATTSLYCHLIQHPQVQYPLRKEPHTLTNACATPGLECPPEVEREYVVDILNLREAAATNFTKATLDGSTHYASEGTWLAPRLREAFPWLRLVISMRDPISQALSMHLHNLSHNRSVPCFEAAGRRIYPCIVEDLEATDRARFGPKVEAWMKAFPRDQLHLVQYESLIDEDSMPVDLRGLKAFLGPDFHQHLPSDTLPLTNWKHMRGGPDALGRYWNMTRGEYEHLTDLARRNTMEVLKLMETYGYAEKQARVDWLRNWELAWRLNLRDNCEEGREGNCKIVVS